MTDSNPQDRKEGRGPTSAVAYGVVFGIIVGTVVFVFTQNVLWLSMGVALGIVAGAAFQANRR